MNLQLSVCFIVKDEVKNIAKALESIKDIASEIIIVDTGSTDNTKAIASKYTDKIYDFIWCDDFSKARNYSLSYATQEWILVFDADFIFEEQSKKLLESYLKSDNDLFYIQCIEELHNFQHPLILLFRNHCNINFYGRVHEQVIFDKSKLKISYADIFIKHTGYTDLIINQEKQVRNNNLFQLSLNDPDLSPLLKLRMEAYILKNKLESNNGDYQSNVIDIYNLIDMTKFLGDEIYTYSQLFESVLVESLKYVQDNIKDYSFVLNHSLKLFSNSINVLYNFSNYFTNIGDYYKSVEVMEFISYLLQTKNPSIDIFSINNNLKNLDLIYIEIISTYYILGDYDSCEYYISKLKDSNTILLAKKSISDKNILHELENTFSQQKLSFNALRLAREYIRIFLNNIDIDPNTIIEVYLESYYLAQKETNAQVICDSLSDLILYSNNLSLDQSVLDELIDKGNESL
ncbi:MAG: glycosyltransferase family 2 protein, partial [Candidatus Sericytochromatia bacterium]|nr:glycosyltransferase family 2 protein [Candidatus Sericytochromatia bacterium]